MANEIRVRTNFTGGMVRNDPLTASGTSLSAYALSRIPEIDSTEHAVIVLDPDGQFGEPEIVYVIAHDQYSLDAVITRAQEGTVARDHPKGTTWTHAPVASDFDMMNYGMTLEEVADVDLSGLTSDKQALVYDLVNNQWVAGAVVSGDVVLGDTDWHNISTAGEPGFQNGWVNYNSNDAMWANCQFRKLNSGLVVMRGLAASGTISTGDAGTMFTLPEGYRPERRLILAARYSGGTGELRIHEDGTVRAYEGNSSGWFSIAAQFYVGL